jgi:hypothetical protein
MKNSTKITRNAISARRSRNPSILIHLLISQVNLGYGWRFSRETACIIEMRGLYALIRQTIKRPPYRGAFYWACTYQANKIRQSLVAPKDRSKNEEQYKNHEKRNFSSTMSVESIHSVHLLVNQSQYRVWRELPT